MGIWSFIRVRLDASATKTHLYISYTKKFEIIKKFWYNIYVSYPKENLYKGMVSVPKMDKPARA